MAKIVMGLALLSLARSCEWHRKCRNDGQWRLEAQQLDMSKDVGHTSHNCARL